MANEIKKIEYVPVQRVITEPWITEAATKFAELNKYVFKVTLDANKKEIKRAIESLYGVSVISVRTIRIPRKERNRGKVTGWKSAFKKAIVTVKAGETIDVFKA